jgi:hypothetical protein
MRFLKRIDQTPTDWANELTTSLQATLQALSADRPIFHSECDFQHALAWAIHERVANAHIRLEKPHEIEGRRRYIDLVVEQDGIACFMELKYKTTETSLVDKGEAYSLKQQGAIDQGSYDILKDVQRIEAVVGERHGRFGFSVTLSNDSRYWRPQRRTDAIDIAFQLVDGRLMEGELAWAPHAGRGSTEKREAPIALRNRHEIRWTGYSSPPSASPFQCLIIPVFA